MVCVDSYEVGNMVYMGKVNNSNKTWHELICVVYNKQENVFKSPRDIETLTWCSPSPLNCNIPNLQNKVVFVNAIHNSCNPYNV